MNQIRQLTRRARRPLAVRAWRTLPRTCLRALPGYARGPDELSQALTAFNRAVRHHHRFARLAPEFFDSTVVDRQARERDKRRRWMEHWEPVLRRAYGPEPAFPPAADSALPRLPGLRTQRVVDRELAGWDFWMAAGARALDRYRQRRPHAIPSLTQCARLLELAFKFKRLATGLDPGSSAPATSDSWAQSLADLKRSYGNERGCSASIPLLGNSALGIIRPALNSENANSVKKR